MKLTRFNFTVLSVCLAIVSGTSAAEAASLTTVATGLNNASGISFGPDGTLYVAETGVGGNGKCQGSPSTIGEDICAGNTGSVTKISQNGKQERIFKNFDSLALQPSKNQGAGPQALEFDSKGNAYLLTGYAGFPGNRDKEINALTADIKLSPEQYIIAPPVGPEEVLNTPNLGKLFKADLKTGELKEVFDFAKYEVLNNPDGGDVISNPFGLAINDDTAYVSDGGGNVIYSVKLDGSDTKVTTVPKISVKNPEFPPATSGQALPPQAAGDNPGTDNPVFGNPNSDPSEIGTAGSDQQQAPPPQAAFGQGDGPVELQAVPTGNTIGPDGATYFGEYTGFPYAEGEAKVYRIGEDGKPEVYADGFTHLTDVAFDKDGNLLALQFSDQLEWKGSTLR